MQGLTHVGEKDHYYDYSKTLSYDEINELPIGPCCCSELMVYVKCTHAPPMMDSIKPDLKEIQADWAGHLDVRFLCLKRDTSILQSIVAIPNRVYLGQITLENAVDLSCFGS